MHPDDPEVRALVLAPTGRDGAAIKDSLYADGINSDVCSDFDTLLHEIEQGVGVVFVAEEALFGADVTALADIVGLQGPWSDLPFLILSSSRDYAAVRAWREGLLAAVHNVTFLERPVQLLTLITSVRAALRARKRQYEVRAHLEDAARSANVLERLVRERTQELEETNAALRVQLRERAEIEERLRHSQKIEAIGQLTGGVAHDFNNLLMVITAGLNLLERKPEKRRDVIESMQKAAARGARLTHQLLAFSRRQSLEPKSIDLQNYFDETSELLNRSLRADIETKVALSENLWSISADPGELQLMILNLAVNARDAMPNGGSILIGAENAPALSPSETDFVKLTFRDTGTGIPASVIERVFEPFFTTKDVGKGSGLGLAQVHGFVTQSGGTIKLSSDEGAGTTVTILLPRAESAPEVDARKMDAVAPVAASGHVLVVEDEDEVAALVCEMFRELGYEVTRTANAMAALGALANGRVIDIVFSDVMMPGGMNGLELLREIRRRRPELPVLLTSGYSDMVREGAKQEGFALLPKPYEFSQLAVAVERLRSGAATKQSLH